MRYALLSLLSTAAAPLYAGDAVLPATFESADYGAWTATGDCFQSGPATGKIGSQKEVKGFKGKHLVNTYHPGDSGTGTLTSPAFKIEKKFLTFLIGGGAHPDNAGLFLLHEGKKVRSATGDNKEFLQPMAWDVSDLMGKEVQLQIVDQVKGGWGHINVDHIQATDDRGDAPLPTPPRQPVMRELTITNNYLHYPLLDRDKRQGPGVAKLELKDADGKVVRFLRLKFPAAGEKPDFWYSADVREFKGQKLQAHYLSTDPKVLELIEQSDTKKVNADAYTGKYRNRFHFSPRQGWMNDVNGTYYQDGLYHLFYQANPTTTAWSTGFDMHWGHSVSKDLLHWEEWDVALHPDHSGNIFSGTAIMVREHIPGVNEGMPLPTPALFYTGTSPFSQHFALSADGGKTFQPYEGNPVLKKKRKADRDPKMIYHEPSGYYVMVLYVGEPHSYQLFRSKNLVDWEHTQTLEGWYECPEFMQLDSPTMGKKRWMLYGSTTKVDKNGKKTRVRSGYQLGDFDGKVFTPDSEVEVAHRGQNFYAALTFMNEPQGRKIMMGWTSGMSTPGEPFNQGATLPLRMQLKDINGKDVLCFEPSKEVLDLRQDAILDLKDVDAASANATLARTLKPQGAYELVVTFEKPEQPLEVKLRNRKFRYDPATGGLGHDHRGKIGQMLPIHPQGDLTARIFLDRALIEAFWNHGEGPYALASRYDQGNEQVKISEKAKIKSLQVYPLKNIWEGLPKATTAE